MVRDNIEKTDCRNENDANTSMSTLRARAGIKPHLDKLNENVNLLEAKNHALRVTNKRMLDNNNEKKCKSFIFK